MPMDSVVPEDAEVRAVRVASGGRSLSGYPLDGVEVEPAGHGDVRQLVYVPQEGFADVVALQLPLRFGAGVFLREPEVHVRENPEALHPGHGLDAGDRVVQQGGVPPEPVDHEPFEPGPQMVRDYPPCAVDRREDASPLDVAHEYGRDVRGSHQAGVGDVAVHDVDLCGRAGPFADDHAVLCAEPAVGLQGLAQQLLAVHRLPSAVVAERLPVDDCLQYAVAAGLQQDRVHVRLGLQPGRPRLERLPHAYLAAVLGGVRVERQVGGLERDRVEAFAGEVPAQHGADGCLPGGRRRPQHQHPHSLPPIIPISLSMSMLDSKASASASRLSSRRSS